MDSLSSRSFSSRDSSDYSTISLLDSSDQTSDDNELGAGPEKSNDECTTPPSTSECADPLCQPLYDGAEVTIYDSYLLLMQHSLRHCLTKQAFGDLLKVVGMLLPNKSMVLYYKLRKYFLDLFDDIVFEKHYCCSNCHSDLEDKDGECCHGCNAIFIEFLTISVVSQLKRKIEGS